ncbi:hypothetical protein J6590_078434 [Homalodisca vitripennis]|nr:hypothetical protein J6590_078434 [Homalodisca vitripennis]
MVLVPLLALLISVSGSISQCNAWKLFPGNTFNGGKGSGENEGRLDSLPRFYKG